MSAPINSKTWLFVLLLFLLAGSVLYNIVPRTFSPIQTKVTAVKKVSVNSAETQVLLTGLLGKQAANFSSVHRNVFEFGSPNAPEMDMPAVMMPPAPIVTPDSTKLPDVRYLAFYTEKDQKSTPIAAIINGGRIYVGVEGEILAGKYEVLRIDDEFIVLRFLPDNRIIRLPMGKEAGIVVEETESASNR